MGKFLMIALSASLLLAGCGSLLDMAHPNELDGLPETYGPHIYGGVRFDIEALGIEKPYGVPKWLITILGVLDLPLSFVMDTLLLFISIPNKLLPPEEVVDPPGEKKAP